MRRSVLVLSLAALVPFVTFVPRKVTVTTSPVSRGDSCAVGDTLSEVLGTTIDQRGQVQLNTTLEWSLQPATAAQLIAVEPIYRHRMKLVCLVPGPVVVTALWRQFGTSGSKTYRVIGVAPPVIPEWQRVGCALDVATRVDSIVTVAGADTVMYSYFKIDGKQYVHRADSTALPGFKVAGWPQSSDNLSPCPPL